MIVDLDPAGGTRAIGRLLMPLAILALALGYVAVAALERPDPEAAARSRARVLAALSAPLVAATERPAPLAGLLGPSVLARRAPRPTLPPPLRVPAEMASAVPAGTADAAHEVRFSASEASRPTVYRLLDGRLFVVQQTMPDRGRPLLPTYALDDGSVRGQPAEFFTSSVGPIRALVWWTEGAASYYLYSSTVTVRELIGLAEQLR